MAESLPILRINRSVLNIGPEDITPLEDRLKEESPASVAPATIHGLFNPSNDLHASIITRRECIRIQRRLDDTLDEAGVEAMGAHLEEVLSDSPQERHVMTSPIRIRQWGPRESGRSALTIANSPGVFSERDVAKKAINEFLGLEIPQPIWMRDGKTIESWLACSRNPEEFTLLKRLKIIVAEEKLLPELTTLGEVDVRYSGVSLLRHNA